MPNRDGTGPMRGNGMGFGRGRWCGRGFGFTWTCVRALPLAEQKKLLEQRKLEIEAEIKALESKTD